MNTFDLFSRGIGFQDVSTEEIHIHRKHKGSRDKIQVAEYFPTVPVVIFAPFQDFILHKFI